MPSATPSTPLSSQPAMKKPPKSPETVLAEAEAQWIFTEAELLQSPSILDGMTPETERELRAKGVNFITQVGAMLKLPQILLSVAGVFFNRFLMRQSIQKTDENPKPLHHYQVAAVALFLASKTEENVRRLRDLIVACCRIAQKNPSLQVDEQSKDYWRWRDTLLQNEPLLLEALCFDLTVDSPHRMLFDMLKILNLEHNKSLRNAAWAFINDSGLTVLCLIHSAKTIAAAALYCGAKYSGAELPGPDSPTPWWKALGGVNLRSVQHACNYMADLYENNSIAKVQMDAIYEGLKTPLADPESDTPMDAVSDNDHADDEEEEEDGEVLEEKQPSHSPPTDVVTNGSHQVPDRSHLSSRASRQPEDEDELGNGSEEGEVDG